MVLINPLTPFPYPTTPLGSGTPLTYREGITVLGLIEKLKEWIEESVAPELHTAIELAVTEFTEGLRNAEETITTIQAVWQVSYDAAIADIETAKGDIEAAKSAWQVAFDAFMVDVVNQLVALNDEAVAQLLSNDVSETNNVAKDLIKVESEKTVEASVGPDVRVYGVALDGITETTISMQLAINAATALGVPLRLPVGRYLIDNVSIPSNTSIIGSGPGTVIVQKDPSRPAFRATGTHALLGSLTEDLLKDATTINILQDWGLVAGDQLMILDSVSYAATDVAYKSGEQFMVKSSTNTAISLTTSVRGSFSNIAESYTVANSALARKIIALKNISLSDMSFEGHALGTTQIIHFTCVTGLTLSGLHTIKGQAGFCYLDIVRDVTVSGEWLIDGLVDNHALGYPGYGYIVRHASHNVVIQDGTSNMARHAITTIGGPYGIPRELVFGPNIVSNDPTSTAVIDTHSSAEGVTIHGNVIKGSLNGVALRARNVTVYNNDISKTVSCAIMVNENGQNISITHNTLKDNLGLGVRVGAGASTHKDVLVAFNDVHRTGTDAISATAGNSNIRFIANIVNGAGGHCVSMDASIVPALISRNVLRDGATGGVSRPAINCVGVQVAGLFDIVNNEIYQETALMNRAVHTVRTAGRMVGNKAFGPFASAGSEFNAGVGFTKDDNMLYA